jgi:hypothetical protein
MARRKSNDPVATCVKERIGADDEGENLLTPDKIERCVDFAGAAGRQRAKLQAKRPRRRLASTKPACSRPLRKAGVGSSERVCRNPITGMAGCCARAPSGQETAAPPSAAMNSRRLK